MWLAEVRDQHKYRVCHMTVCVTYSVIMASKEAGRERRWLHNSKPTEILEERNKSEWLADKTKLEDANVRRVAVLVAHVTFLLYIR